MALAWHDMCWVLTQAIIVLYVCFQPILGYGNPAQTTQHRQQQVPVHYWLLRWPLLRECCQAAHCNRALETIYMS